MYHRPARSALLLILFSLLFSILPPGIGGAAATGRPATAALANTPVNLVEEPLPFQEWAVGGGFIYWSKCGTGPGPKQQAEDSSAPIDSEVGYLRRKPTGGGLVKSLSLGQFNPGCSLSSEMAADSSGLYYWDGHAIIQRSVSAPDTPVILYTGTANQAPVTRLVFDQNAVFWASSTQIFRVAKNGSGGGAIVDSHGYPTALVVYINSVSWISDRLWSVSASCTVACNAESANLARGHTLVANMFRYWSSGEGIMEDALRGCYTLRIWCYPKAIYNTSAPWHIGALAISGTSLFWVENHQRDCTDPTACFREPSPDGVLHRLTLSSGATAENIAENIPNYGDQLYTDEHGVYFEQSPPGYRRIISRLPLDARPIVHDLAVDSWEVTQGIQNLANDVPLVAGKPTYVRAYAVQRDGPRAGGVSMLLYGARNGIPLPDSPQKSLNGTHSLEMGQHDDRANGDAGWLFKLPDSWTTGGPIELRAVLDPRSFYTDPDRSNNTRSATFTFTRMAPVCIVTVPVRTHGPAANNLGANVFFARDMVRRLWPVSDVWLYHQDNDIAELQARFGIPPWEYGPYEIPENTTKILVSLTERDFFSDDPDKCDNVSARTHYVGIVSPETPTGNADPNLGTNGSGRDGNDQAWIKLPPADFARDDWRARRAATLAHELAHNYERKHVNCGNPEDVDENYPYRDNNGTACLLDDRDIKDANTYYGFDTDMQQPIGPTKAQDLMGYTCSPDPDCVPRWISDYTWRGLFSTIPDRQRMALASEHPAAAAVLPNLAEASSVVLVSGVITPSVASAELNYPFVFPTNTVSPQMLRKWQRHAALPAGVSLPGVPNYHLRLLDAGNQALDDRTVTLDETADGEESTKGFTLAFPAPAMPVARIELLDGDRVLAHLQPGISMPSASIITPAGGENITNTLTLSWHASDPDSNDLLLYTVQYSPDQGKTWRALLTSFPNMTSSPTMTVELKNLSGIPGSSSGGARIRVAASDGYNTTLATSEPFTVTNRLPEPYISSPTPGQTEAAGRTISLRGGAMDVEDGSLTGAALRWSIDGRAIGTGQDQIVEGLAPGTYTVTLTATDGSGNERSTSAPLTVAPLSVPGGGAPTLDGACDDPAYAGATRLQLPAYSDGTQATTQLIHTSTDLWVCLSGMARSSAESGSLAGIHVDINNSRDPVAQADDYGFLVGEDGTPLTQSGDSKGGFVQGGPSGLTSRIGADATSWSAELRIPVSALGGWDRVVGLEVGQYNLSTTGDGYHWPVRAGSAEPNTWARTVLGAIPEITDISPASAMAGDPALSLTVTGANFGPDMAVQWAGELRPTTFISSTQLVAAISSGDLATGGSIPVTISSPSLSTVTSNAATFSVNNPIPSISSVTSPGWSSEGMTLAINGTNFVSGTQIIVNGLALPTMVLSSTQLVALASSADLKGMKVVSIAALNSAPGGGLSNAIPFKVIYRVFLPFAIGGTEPANGPDLVGSISISPNKRTFSAGEPVTITATITNVGNAPTGAFWADLFINPSQPPTTANVRWNDVCKLQPCFGIAWTVSDGLAPGQSITLTSRSYPAGYSLWPGWFASGTTDLYLYVDTWNPGVPYGTVAEYNEANNGTALHGLIVSGKNPTQPNLSETMDLLPRPTLKNT